MEGVILLRVAIEYLKDNMCISEDVYTTNDMLVVAGNTVVTENIINRLKLFGVDEVEILEPGDEKHTFTFNITETVEFKKYKEDSTIVKDSLSNSFNSIITDSIEKEDAEQLFDLGRKLFDDNRDNPNVLDILHSMQQFSDTTYLHCVNVGMIAGLIGKWLGWEEDEIYLLVECGLFHDIGKLLIPRDIINKPGKLNDNEYAVMKQHTVRGYKLLADNPYIDDRVKLAALMHHERCDGKGYPFMLKKDKIDRFSKVVAIADVYDAMTANRIYRGPMCPFDVIAIFEREGLHMYETRYIMTFLHRVLHSYLNSKVHLSNGAVAEIVQINPAARAKPIVMMSNGKIIDLSVYDNVRIDSIM